MNISKVLPKLALDVLTCEDRSTFKITFSAIFRARDVKVRKSRPGKVHQGHQPFAETTSTVCFSKSIAGGDAATCRQQASLLGAFFQGRCLKIVALQLELTFQSKRKNFYSVRKWTCREHLPVQRHEDHIHSVRYSGQEQYCMCRQSVDYC